MWNIYLHLVFIHKALGFQNLFFQMGVGPWFFEKKKKNNNNSFSNCESDLMIVYCNCTQ